MARKPNRKPTRDLFRGAVQQHTSGDQVSGEPQAIDLSGLDLGTTEQTSSEAQQQGQAEQTVDLSKVNLRGTPKPSRLGGKSREELLADMRASELDEQLQIRADARAKKIRSRPEFQPGAGFYTSVTADPSEAGVMLAKLKAGGGTLHPLSAKNGHKYLQDLHKELSDFVTNVPTILKAKADAHEAAANELEKLYPGHPEVSAHRNEAASIRGLLPGGPDVRNNLREARDSDPDTGISQDSSRSLERILRPIKNKLVEAQADIAVVPITAKEEAAGLGKKGTLSDKSSRRTHPAIKKAHATLKSVHKDVNDAFRNYGIGTPTGPAAIDLKTQRIDNLQDKKADTDVSQYRDIRDDLEEGADGRLSKPGHIWGDEVTVAGKRTGDREQIPISKESIDMLKARTGGNKQRHLTRMRSIINSGKSPEQKTQESNEARDVTLFAYSPEAEEASMVKARAAGRTIISSDGKETEFAPAGGPRQQRRDGNKLKSVSIDPKKINPAGTHRDTVRRVAATRAGVSETERHMGIAVRALIDGKDIPSETMDHFDSLPNKNGEADGIAEKIFARRDEHQAAVEGAIKSISETGKMSKEHREIFKREGTNPVEIVKLANKPKGA